MLNFSESCERNKDPILAHLRDVFKQSCSILEIGSGSGQHALFFGQYLTQLHWYPSDQGEYLPGLRENVANYPVPNVHSPVALDVSHTSWPDLDVDGVFSANSLHIMSWDHVKDFFRGVGQVLKSTGVLCVYGPFKYENQYTSESNARFDSWLKDRDPVSAIRDFEQINMLAENEGFKLKADYLMPANNQLLVWVK